MDGIFSKLSCFPKKQNLSPLVRPWIKRLAIEIVFNISQALPRMINNDYTFNVNNRPKNRDKSVYQWLLAG